MPRRRPTRPPLRFLSPIHRSTRQIGDYLREKTASLGLSNDEGHCLSYLLSYAPCTVGELVRVFGHKPSTLTSMLDRLELAGHLERTPNPDDRRSFIIRLTESGARAAERMRAEVDELEQAIDSEIEEDQREGFATVMAAIEKVTKERKE